MAGRRHQGRQQFEALLPADAQVDARRDARGGMFDSDESRMASRMLDQQMAQRAPPPAAAAASPGHRPPARRQQRDAAVTPPEAECRWNAAIRRGFDAAGRSCRWRQRRPPGGKAPCPPGQWQTVRQRQSAIGRQKSAARRRLPPADGRGAASARSGRPVPGPRAFVEKVWPQAVEASRATGIPARFLVAQAALETGWGKYELKNADGSPSHNLFNIKAGKRWAAATR